MRCVYSSYILQLVLSKLFVSEPGQCRPFCRIIPDNVGVFVCRIIHEASDVFWIRQQYRDNSKHYTTSHRDGILLVYLSVSVFRGVCASRYQLYGHHDSPTPSLPVYRSLVCLSPLIVTVRLVIPDHGLRHCVIPVPHSDPDLGKC